MSLSKDELAHLLSVLVDNGTVKVASDYDYATLNNSGDVKYTYGDYESPEKLSDKPQDAWPLVAIDPQVLKKVNEMIE